MNVNFRDKTLEELFEKGTTKDKRLKAFSRNAHLVAGYITAVNTMRQAQNAAELAQYSFLHYEKLRGRPESSVRILNRSVERLLFLETDGGITIELLEINQDHYGNKK